MIYERAPTCNYLRLGKFPHSAPAARLSGCDNRADGTEAEAEAEAETETKIETVQLSS